MRPGGPGIGRHLRIHDLGVGVPVQCSLGVSVVYFSTFRVWGGLLLVGGFTGVA